MSDLSLDLDDDYERRARLGGIGHFPLQPLLNPILPVPLGSASPISSIDVAEQRPTTAKRQSPALPLPSKNIMLEVLRAHNETERLTGKQTDIFHAEVTQNSADLEKLSGEKDEALRKEAEAAKSRDSWSAFSNIAQYITGIGTIFVGTTMGGVPGAVMVAAGVVGTGNRIIQDSGFLKAAVAWYTQSDELQRKITHQIETTASALSLGLGLAGGAAAWYAGTFAVASGVELAQKISIATTTASTIAGASSQVGVNVYNKRKSDILATMKEIDLKMTTASQKTTQEVSTMSQLFESNNSENDVVRRAIQNLEVPLD